MKIVICIKPVSYSSVYGIDENYKSQYVINPYDLFLIKQIEQLKNTYPIQCIALSMGTMASNDILTKCLAMGMDKAVLLSDTSFAGSDTYATSYILSKAIQKIGAVDFIICGEKAVDGETGQVPYELAQRMGLKVYSGVQALIDIKDGYLDVERVFEKYIQEELIPAPSIIVGETFTTNNHDLSFLQLKRARSKKCICWNHNDLNIDTKKCGTLGSKTKVLECRNVNNSRKNKQISGEVEKVVKNVLTIIKPFIEGV